MGKKEVHKGQKKELEELPAISSIHKISSVHDFYANFLLVYTLSEKC